MQAFIPKSKTRNKEKRGFRIQNIFCFQQQSDNKDGRQSSPESRVSDIYTALRILTESANKRARSVHDKSDLVYFRAPAVRRLSTSRMTSPMGDRGSSRMTGDGSGAGQEAVQRIRRGRRCSGGSRRRTSKSETTPQDRCWHTGHNPDT